MKGNYAILIREITNFNQLIRFYDDTGDKFKSRYQSTVHTLADKYNGDLQEIKTETITIVFKEPSSALHFAINIFNYFSLNPRIPYKISISCGLVEYDSTGIYGEAAQIASRLNEICTEGAVLFTDSILNQIKANEFPIRQIGKTYLKGINSPMEIFCLAGGDFYIPSQAELFTKQKNLNSIAVLPFHNTSAENELDYICDGIAEEVIDSLNPGKKLFIGERSQLNYCV